MENGKSFVKNYPFPEVLKNALKEIREVKTASGDIFLNGWREAKMITLLVDHLQATSEGLVLTNDPNLWVRGTYCVPAYSLVDMYMSVMIGQDENLVWVPKINLFGTYFSNPGKLYVYPGATWETIEAELPEYLGYEKDDEDIRYHLNLWEHFDFLPDHLAAETMIILSAKPNNKKLERIEQLILQYEKCLLKLPFNDDLYHHYLQLLSLYVYRVNHRRDKFADEILEWYDRISDITGRLRGYVAELV